jgi:hypothetical protein
MGARAARPPHGASLDRTHLSAIVRQRLQLVPSRNYVSTMSGWPGKPRPPFVAHPALVAAPQAPPSKPHFRSRGRPPALSRRPTPSSLLLQTAGSSWCVGVGCSWMQPALTASSMMRVYTTARVDALARLRHSLPELPPPPASLISARGSPLFDWWNTLQGLSHAPWFCPFSSGQRDLSRLAPF